MALACFRQIHEVLFHPIWDDVTNLITVFHKKKHQPVHVPNMSDHPLVAYDRQGRSWECLVDPFSAGSLGKPKILMTTERREQEMVIHMVLHPLTTRYLWLHFPKPTACTRQRTSFLDEEPRSRREEWHFLEFPGKTKCQDDKTGPQNRGLETKLWTVRSIYSISCEGIPWFHFFDLFYFILWFLVGTCWYHNIL